MAIANLGSAVKRKIKWKERNKNILSYINSYFYHSLITITSEKK